MPVVPAEADLGRYNRPYGCVTRTRWTYAGQLPWYLEPIPVGQASACRSA